MSAQLPVGYYHYSHMGKIGSMRSVEYYVELQKDVRALREKSVTKKDKKKLLQAEVRFLRHKYKMFTEKDDKETTDPLVFPKSGAHVHSVDRRPKEPSEVLAIEDEPARRELTWLHALALVSTDHCTSPEMNGLQPTPVRIIPCFKVPQGSFFTPTVVDSQNEKVKVDPLISPESSAKIISISKRPKRPTEVLAIEDQSARHELIGMQPLLSTDDCAAPKMTGLQPSGMQTMLGFKVHHSTLITPAAETANKRRRLANNGVTGPQKPSKAKDGKNRKVKADPSLPEFAAKNISIPIRPKELTEALAIDDEPARYELTGMQPSLSTDNCTMPVMTGQQPSIMRKMRGSIVPPGSFVTRVEPTNKKRPLEDNELVGSQKPSNVKDSWNKKIKAAPVVECGVETPPISGEPKESTEGLPIEDRSARHELTGLQLFSSSNACISPEMTGLLPSATRMMSPFTVPQGLSVTTIVKPTIRKRQNNGLVHAKKPSEVKGRQRKKTKGIPQKPISLIEEKGAGSFWDN